MIRNDLIHWLLLGLGLEFPDDRNIGRDLNITQVWLKVKEKCFECDMGEVLDALKTLRREHAEVCKILPVSGGFQRVSFERVRNTNRWIDFLMTGYFNIRVLPEGRVNYQRLSEQISREFPPPEPPSLPIGFTGA
jgi:hypothetical protein